MDRGGCSVGKGWGGGGGGLGFVRRSSDPISEHLHCSMEFVP